MMSKHPNYVVGYEGSLEDLARAVGNMTYDQTADFIEKLADDLKQQADSDYNRGRKKLAKSMYGAVEKLYSAKEDVDKAWDICESRTTTVHSEKD